MSNGTPPTTLERIRAILMAAGVVGATATSWWVAEYPHTGGGTSDEDELLIASFNIKWLGHYANKDLDNLALMMADYDIVVVQELMTTPFDRDYGGGDTVDADSDAVEFVAAMAAQGFDVVVAEEDTGQNTNHSNTTASEWPIAFYRAGRVMPSPSLPRGYIDTPLVGHGVHDRVPFAFPFRTVGDEADFVLISVHLDRHESHDDERAAQLRAIGDWADGQPGPEQDYVILGDMNLQDCDELDNTPDGFESLNGTCEPTNTAENGRPYDHIMYRAAGGDEVDLVYGMMIYDLIEYMEPLWDPADGPYPGRPYDGDRFAYFYSDHHPVEFKLRLPAEDDD